MACVFFEGEVMKDEERLRNCSSFKETKEIKQQLIAIWIGFWSRKKITLL